VVQNWRGCPDRGHLNLLQGVELVKDLLSEGYLLLLVGFVLCLLVLVGICSLLFTVVITVVLGLISYWDCRRISWELQDGSHAATPALGVAQLPLLEDRVQTQLLHLGRNGVDLTWLRRGTKSIWLPLGHNLVEGRCSSCGVGGLLLHNLSILRG